MWWNGPDPRPAVPAASAAPGSTGAGLSCGRAQGERHGSQPRRGTAPTTPCPAALPPRPRTCASPARCAPTCGRDRGDQHRRHRPLPPTHPLSYRSPDAAHGPARRRRAESGVAVLGPGQAERVPVLAVLQELGRLQQHLDAAARGLHGGRLGGPRAARSLAAGRPAPLTSPRRANKFRRESACFKFESAGGDGSGHAPPRLGHAPVGV